jgi:hypothetical protein
MGASNHHDDAFRKKVAHKISTSSAMAGAGQSFRSVPKVAAHRLWRTTCSRTISPGGDTPDRTARTSHKPLSRPKPQEAPRRRSMATPTTGIAAPKLMLSGLRRRATPNIVIPVTRTTVLLCRGSHQSYHHRQTSKTPPRHRRLGTRCCRRGHQSCGSPTTIA